MCDSSASEESHHIVDMLCPWLSFPLCQVKLLCLTNTVVIEPLIQFVVFKQILLRGICRCLLLPFLFFLLLNVHQLRQDLCHCVRLVASYHTKLVQVLLDERNKVSFPAVAPPVPLFLRFRRVGDDHAVNLLTVFISQHEVWTDFSLRLVELVAPVP